MHHTARANARRFFAAYPVTNATVLEIGSQDVGGGIRDVCPYPLVGVDFVPGRGVDVVLADPYSLPFETDSQDIVVSSSVLEHSEFFWLLFEEIARVVRPGGLIYLNAPANGAIHRYPVDCWRFYPDSGHALARWAVRKGYPIELLESYTSNQRVDLWNDCVAVFAKKPHAFRSRIVDAFSDYRNGWNGRELRPSLFPQKQAGPLDYVMYAAGLVLHGETRLQRKLRGG